MLQVQMSGLAKADVTIETGQCVPYYPPVAVNGNNGEIIKLEVKDARVIRFEDPQGVLNNGKIEKGVLVAKLTATKGYYTVILQVMSGKALQWRVFRIRVNDPVRDSLENTRIINKIPVNVSWQNVDIRPLLNADITKIYQQKYLSPRPNTVSVRLGTDGYSPWTFPYWKRLPPAIKLDKVKNMLDDKNRITTPQRVPFIWNGGVQNIAFTSMWDNYPTKIDFPVNRRGKAIYFLVSGSTNVMQCQITNAVIRLNYTDGQIDSLELVPPVNYWNLSPMIEASASPTGQSSRNDYTSEIDKFCLPAKLPEIVQLGENCRAMLLNLKLRQGVELKSISLETLSQEMVIGIIGITIMN
jgi:hypothetical protein